MRYEDQLSDQQNKDGYTQVAEEIGQKRRYYETGFQAVKELISELFARRIIGATDEGITLATLRILERKLDILEEIQWREVRP